MREFDYNNLELIARRAGKHLEAVYFDPTRSIAMIKTSQDYMAFGQSERRIVRFYFQTSRLDKGLEDSFSELVLEYKTYARGLLRKEIERITIACMEG